MKKAVIALCVLVLLFGAQIVSAKVEMQTVSLHLLETKDPTQCGPEAPVRLENVGRAVLRFDPATTAPVEYTLFLKVGLPDSAYSFYVAKYSPDDPCHYIIWSTYPHLTDKNGKLWIQGTLGTIVQSGDRLAMVLISSPLEDLDQGSGPHVQVIQSDFFTVP